MPQEVKDHGKIVMELYCLRGEIGLLMVGQGYKFIECPEFNVLREPSWECILLKSMDILWDLFMNELVMNDDGFWSMRVMMDMGTDQALL